MSCAVFSKRRWRHLRENCHIKIASKNRNCGDAKFFFIFCRKKQRTNANSERSKGGRYATCRRRKIYAMIGVEFTPLFFSCNGSESLGILFANFYFLP